MFCLVLNVGAKYLQWDVKSLSEARGRKTTNMIVWLVRFHINKVQLAPRKCSRYKESTRQIGTINEKESDQGLITCEQ